MDTEFFAAQLRKHCDRFHSISEVCRLTDINRQQFGKYLSGAMLPNARSLQKICKVLEVSAEELMTGSPATARPSTDAVNKELREIQHVGSIEMLSLLATQRLGYLTGGGIRSANDMFPVGYYYCYFPLHQSSPILLRSLLSLKVRAGVMYFSRRTYIPAVDNGWRYISRGQHFGVVLGTGSEAYFVGYNRIAPHQLSFMTINIAPVMETRYSGLSLTRKGREAIAANTFLHYLGKSMPRRELLKSIGMVTPFDPTLDPVIALLMDATRSAGQGQIHALHIDDLLSDQSYHTADPGFQRAG